ncbi:hypothetical protein HGA64_05560, partial [Candidatus Falkowbacteria bacterium]|nr:hypothetical protein [Candidatus Falkowbacteria bacterium]
MEQSDNQATSATPQTTPSIEQTPVVMSFESLYTASIDIYKKLFLKIVFYPIFAVLISLLPLMLILAIWGLTKFASLPLGASQAVNILLGLLGLVALLLVFFVMFLTAQIPYLLVAKNPDAKFKELLLDAKKNLVPFTVVVVLQCLVVLGGFILLIIPGFYLLVRFSFAAFAYMFEGYEGASALKRSSELVKGNWWGVALRLLSVYAFIFIVTLLIGTLANVAGPKGSSARELISGLSSIINLLLSPFYLIV